MRNTLNLYVLSGLLALQGCADNSLSKGGSHVRDISPETAAGCQFIVIVVGRNTWGSPKDDQDDQLTAGLNDARNRVATAGGNAMKITQSSTGATGIVRAEAYNCSEF